MHEQTEAERKAEAIRRAWWLAMSGAFADWAEVAERLAGEGAPEARSWLNEARLRDELDRVCAEARARRPE